MPENRIPGFLVASLVENGYFETRVPEASARAQDGKRSPDGMAEVPSAAFGHNQNQKSVTSAIRAIHLETHTPIRQTRSGDTARAGVGFKNWLLRAREMTIGF